MSVTVRSSRPTSSAHFRRVCRRERLRSTFWYIPTVFILTAAVLALVMHRLGEVVGVGGGARAWWALDAGTATTVLSTIAAAMLTFVGVVFSITLVALQLASSQLSPRVLRSFVRSPIPKIAFGTFMATFLYALILLARTSEAEDGRVPVLGTGVALLLVGASVGIFLVYVNATIRQMQVSEVISSVASETRRAIAENYPGPEHYLDASLVDLAGRSGTLRRDRSSGHGRRGRNRGVLLAVDIPGIVDLARAHDAVIRLRTRVGDYAPEGTRLFDVIGGADLDLDQLNRMVDFGRERSLYQDALYGIRQLVDTAAQALSAAINAPTTAVQVIDRLVDLVARIGCLPAPTGYVADGDGHVRYIHIVATWDDVVALAFTEIRLFGRASSQVTRRLMAAFDEVMDRVPDELHPAVERQRRALIADVGRVVVDPDDRATALRPDSMGLG